jgi:hypothetical protein
MTKLNEVLELVRAGYTKAEIAALTEDGKAPQPEETAAPAVQPEVQEEHTETQADPAPAAAEPVDHNAAILEAIDKLSNAFITNNINTQTQPENSGRTIEQALAEIIRPTYHQRSE